MNRVKEDWLIWRGMWLMVGLVLALAVSVWWIEGRVPPQIPLLYSRPWGEGQLVGRQILWWLVGGFFGVGVFGAVLGLVMMAKERVTARIVIWSTVLVEALGLVTMWNVWWRVGV